MLTYLINVTDDLLAVFTVIGVLFAVVDRYCADRGRYIYRGGVFLGALIAAIRAYITNTRRISGSWRIGTYGNIATLVFFLLAVIAVAVFLRRLTTDPEEKKNTPAEFAVSITTGLLAAGYLYGALPTVYYYPFGFNSNGNGILSTDYLFRLGGYLLGLIICFAALLSVYQVLTVLSRKGHEAVVPTAFYLMNTILAVKIFGRLCATLTTRKIIVSSSLFRLSAWSNNHSALYTYALFAFAAVLGIYLWVSSVTAREPYLTKAEHRKQRALWRTGKHYTAVVVVCAVMAVLCTTWFVDLNTVVIVEAPMEDPIIVKDGAGNDSELRVPLEMVSDGHLHRFGYTTSDGTVARFIVVLKVENTNNYGVGLDACDICGEAGYYENKDGQVVCKKCNVVMNTTTIGMKGGCNPIIIEYDINEEYISVPVSEMEKNASKFK